MGRTADELRAAMVETIRDRHGVHDERVLAAMASVPRHDFADPAMSFEQVYDVTSALPARGFDPSQVTTTVSAPNLVAWTVQELAVEPGHRVLEIGTGSGYNAALLATLGCIVTTVDIDTTLIEPARTRLGELGFDERAVHVRHGDGDVGWSDGAPYDRIVATVGCNDLAPAWFSQLAPDGFLLAPVRHGSFHPTVRAAGGVSRMVTFSGFVRMLGRQDQATVWDAPAFDVLPVDAAWWFLTLRSVTGAPSVEAARREWHALGEPDASRFTSHWVPRGTGTGVGSWVVPRIHHDEVVSLP